MRDPMRVDSIQLGDNWRIHEEYGNFTVEHIGNGIQHLSVDPYDGLELQNMTDAPASAAMAHPSGRVFIEMDDGSGRKYLVEWTNK